MAKTSTSPFCITFNSFRVVPYLIERASGLAKRIIERTKITKDLVQKTILCRKYDTIQPMTHSVQRCKSFAKVVSLQVNFLRCAFQYFTLANQPLVRHFPAGLAVHLACFTKTCNSSLTRPLNKRYFCGDGNAIERYCCFYYLHCVVPTFISLKGCT